MFPEASPPLRCCTTRSQTPLNSCDSSATANWLLARLPQEDFERLAPHLEHVTLSKGRHVFHAGDRLTEAYFPLSGMVSLLAASSRSETVEVAIVGSEGMVGLPILLHADATPYEAIVLVPASACRIQAHVLLAEFRRGGAFQQLLLHYANSLLAQFSQSALCHRFHTTLQRLSRWLLMARDRLDSDSLELTQESLAHVLGIQRTYVNAAALELANAGLIRYRHGKITILNRERLTRAACECYSTFRDQINQLAPAR